MHDDVDRILAGEESVVPSSGFTASVMEAVSKEILFASDVGEMLSLIASRPLGLVIIQGALGPLLGWLSDRIGRYRTMSIAFTLGGLAIFGLLELVRLPLGFVVFSCLTAFTWGASFVLFSAAIGDAFGTDYAATNNGIHYTSKGVAAIFAGWGAARVVEATGSWSPVFWLGVACNLMAAFIVLFVLRPAISRAMARRREATSSTDYADCTDSSRGRAR